MISLKQIEYVLALEQAGHFGRAADHCAITQSALSNAVTALEGKLGFAVFVRDQQRINVTARGREFLARARTVQQAVNELHTFSQASDQARRLRFGFADGICECVAAELVLTLDREESPLSLSFTEGETEYLMEQVRRGFLDTAVVALPQKHTGLLSFPFWEERYVVVTHRDDPLVHASKLDQQALADANLMLLQPGAGQSRHALTMAGLSPDTYSSLSATSLLTLVECVRSGLGCTLLPESAFAALAATDPELVSLQLETPGPHRRLACLIRPDYPELATVQYLMRFMQAQLAASMARCVRPAPSAGREAAA